MEMYNTVTTVKPLCTCWCDSVRVGPCWVRKCSTWAPRGSCRKDGGRGRRDTGISTLLSATCWMLFFLNEFCLKIKNSKKEQPHFHCVGCFPTRTQVTAEWVTRCAHIPLTSWKKPGLHFTLTRTFPFSHLTSAQVPVPSSIGATTQDLKAPQQDSDAPDHAGGPPYSLWLPGLRVGAQMKRAQQQEEGAFVPWLAHQEHSSFSCVTIRR